MTDRATIAALLMASIAVLAIAAGGVAADSFDTGSGDATTTSSDVSGDSTTVDLRPGNDSESTYVEINASKENRTLVLKPENADGEVVDYVVYENDTPTNETSAAAANDKVHLSWTINHSEIEDIPRDVDGADYRLQILADGNDSVILNTTINFNHVTNDSKTAVIHVANTTDATTHEVADDLEISETFGFFGAAEFWKDNGTTVSDWSAYTAVNQSNETVEIHMIDDDAATSYDDAAEDYEDGDWIRESTLWINGIPVKVYKNDAPDDAPDNYAIYHVDDDELELVRSDSDFELVRTVQVRGTGGDGYDFGTLWSEFGAWDAVSSQIPTMSSLGL